MFTATNNRKRNFPNYVNLLFQKCKDDLFTIWTQHIVCDTKNTQVLSSWFYFYNRCFFFPSLRLFS